METWWRKILRIIRVEPLLGGLEISDVALRVMRLARGKWEGVTVKLAPGIIQDGEVRDRGSFVLALKELHKHVAGPRGTKKKVNVIIALSSLGIYTQSFSLPIIEGENLEKAVELNLKMASPAELSQTYSGWQLIGEDKQGGRLEILSAFASKKAIDEIVADLHEAGFLPVACESSAFSLARLLREKMQGFDPAKSYLVLNLRSGGMDFLIVRKGALYFEYFVNWKDVQAEGKKIPLVVFQGAVIRNVRQVITFYTQHWQEPLGDMVVLSGGLNDEVMNVVTSNFPLVPKKPTLAVAEDIAVEWLPSLGVGLRTLLLRRKDQEINLLGPEAQTEFTSQHFLSFLRFWRVVMPVSLGFLVGVMFLSHTYLDTLRKKAQEKIGFQSPQAAVASALATKVRLFNESVKGIAQIRADFRPTHEAIQSVTALAAASEVSITKFSFRGFGQVSRVEGEARGDEQVRKFKNMLENAPRMRSVALPIDAVRPGGIGSVFYVEFIIARE